MVYPLVTSNADIGVSQSAQQIASLPIPFTTVLGLTFPHPGHFFATNGSPTKLPSRGVSVPDAEALEVILIFLILRATPSPTSAPSTATGRLIV